MDLNAIKSKLDTLQKKETGKKFEKKDYSLTQWKPAVGKHTIRIVPSVYDSENPFTELKFHYEFKGTILSPLSYGEKDPVAEFAAKLRANYSAENYKLAKQLDPKPRIFVPVIVRGEEEKGVRLWQFGKMIYEELLSLAADEEVGDFTDIANGRDFTVEIIDKASTGTDYNKTTIRPKMKTSPIGTDKVAVKKWLTEQPKPVDEFHHFTFDEIKETLRKWLTPEETEVDESVYVTEVDEDSTQPAPKQAAKFSLDTAVSVVKSSKEDKFNALFADEENEVTELPLENEEDLPINKK